jgi:6-phosphofructokinase
MINNDRWIVSEGKIFLSVEDVETRPRCRAAMRARDGIKSNVAVGETFGMSASKRTIGVSTGGGDCPGLNAVIRAVVRTRRADVILIPEIPFTIETACESIRRRGALGRSFCLVVVAEGVKLPERDALGKPFPKPQPGQVANSIGYAIREFTNKEVRVTVLGHVQRGGSPSPFDRTLATRFGVAVVDLLGREEFDKMVCLRAGEIESVPHVEAIGALKLVDPKSDYVRAARAVGITFGDRP